MPLCIAPTLPLDRRRVAGRPAPRGTAPAPLRGRPRFPAQSRRAQAEDVEAGLVARHQLVVIVAAPAAVGIFRRPGRLALLALGRVVERHELVEILALERAGFQREVFVGAQVVDPQLLYDCLLYTSP